MFSFVCNSSETTVPFYMNTITQADSIPHNNQVKGGGGGGGGGGGRGEGGRGSLNICFRRNGCCFVVSTLPRSTIKSRLKPRTGDHVFRHVDLIKY